ncbi:MAG: class I SAM-dependent methyltransferase [Acidobacteria bacterium]|nr:class I SAM-dependent methyltransferase [Acidobacteriota bacterium]
MRSTRWLATGLFFATFSTLLLEILDARLLSVLTWYHLSFFAVSLAMLGMAAGAVFVFLRPAFAGERARTTLATTALVLTCAIPASHLLTLSLPFLPLTRVTPMELLSVGWSTIALAVPFVLSGIVVTSALTRCGGPIGRLYAVDLVGAATACALVVPLLERTNVSSAILLAGSAAAAAAWCFARFAGRRGTAALVLGGAITATAIVNTTGTELFQVIYPKNRQLWLTNALNAVTRWNSHSYVLVQRPGDEPAFMWGPGIGAERFRNRTAWLAIDGEAGTPITQWNGDPAALEWVSYDVTALPYSLRHGDVAVIGVGGGRDILSALWGRNPSITGIDVNRIMIDLLTGSHRDFARIALQPQVTLVHDDGRAYLTRTDRRFDVIQMSLVDTWAATGAGAFTLSENGLYTLDAWRVFLDRLEPGGVLSVSRWFDPHNVSETSRLAALGVAALLDRGVAAPADHLLLVSRGSVATLMISTAPFTGDDERRLDAVVSPRGFTVLLAPWREGTGLLGRIGRSTTRDALDRATADPFYDYSPPTDRRPYYFNMLKPRAILALSTLGQSGALSGNLRATLMLLTLLGIATALVLTIIVWPLARAGRPPMPGGRFAWSMAFFAAIGFGYMLIQIGLLQRFAVYIGHPTYTLAIVLCSMLLFTGLGSFASERLSLAGRAVRLVPLAVAAVLLLTALALPSVLARTVTAGLAARTGWVLAFTAPLSMLLGLCFPIGVRLLSRTPSVTAWAWGINGAFGVLASIAGVAISMWIEIDGNFWIAAALYAATTAPLATMLRAQRTDEEGAEARS